MIKLEKESLGNSNSLSGNATTSTECGGNSTSKKMRFIDKYPNCGGCPGAVICESPFGGLIDPERVCNSYGNKEEQDAIEQELFNEIGECDPYGCC